MHVKVFCIGKRFHVLIFPAASAYFCISNLQRGRVGGSADLWQQAQTTPLSSLTMVT